MKPFLQLVNIFCRVTQEIKVDLELGEAEETVVKREGQDRTDYQERL